MGHEFITPDNSYDRADGILAESADQSTSVDHSHYGVVEGGVPRLSNNILPPSRTDLDNQEERSEWDDLSDHVRAAHENHDLISTVLQEHNKLDIPSCGASSQGLGGYLDNSNLASAGGLSPPTSGFLEHERALLNSPLPPSSVACISSPDSMDDLMLPSSDQPEILPVHNNKGKGRTYEPGQPFASIDKVSASRRTGRADGMDQPKSSSISPIIDRKGKRKACETVQPRSIERPQSHSASKSSLGPVTPHIYQNCKHVLEHVSETEAEEESSRSLKRLRQLQTSFQEADMDVISLSSSDDASLLPKASKSVVDLLSNDDCTEFIVPNSS
ncbi:hypothetical protein DFJ58DRAFT_734079 [Suillus subalutaceus]|uniref:uncharacterized protein n=1 Tax=Suillus subalutaceus TaxID=48586 RepID=UPI001B87A5E5|nr:uncharacterized protein DFJ58DRAFT_734079 [Suillus subalutaceus]KAG1837983.1 hypothetical protein DFJ58DRAFT_734079 [Suillus subalutaceus]